MGSFGAGIAMKAVAQAASAYGTYVQSRNQEKAAKFNAKVMRHRAADSYQRGVSAEQRQRKMTGLLVGHQRALVGSSGAAVGEGAGARIIEDTMAEGEIDALMIRNNAAREAWGFEAQARQFDFAARVADKQKKVGSQLALLGGGANLAGDIMLRK